MNNNKNKKNIEKQLKIIRQARCPAYLFSAKGGAHRSKKDYHRNDKHKKNYLNVSD